MYTVGPVAVVAAGEVVVALASSSSRETDSKYWIRISCYRLSNNHHVMDLKSIGDATAYPSRFVVDSTRAKPFSFDSNSVRWKPSVGTRLKGTVVVLAIKEIQVIET